ncbi:hypothetical protein TWF718_007168 [Orbilia javanica]|uniref:Helicase C-terminal domain-containing protein n=1 Tax=Orbilia javanica TaxID=47235 RepID=A0AAN8MZN0_9PEZI
MPRKGASAKRRLSNEFDGQQPVEHPAQNEQLRRTRSRMTLRSAQDAPKPSQTQPRVNANASRIQQTGQFADTETPVDATTSIPAEVSSQAFSGVRLLQALPNASNIGISTIRSGRITRSRSSAAYNSNENLPPLTGKRKRAIAEDLDDDEFGTPVPVDEDEESDFEEGEVHETDIEDEGEDQRPSRSKSRRKSTEEKVTETYINIKEFTRATLLKSSPANKFTDSSMDDLPPLSDIDDIFEDLTKNHEGLVNVAEHLNGRPLRVATMCSGTESPLLALGLIIKHLSKLFGVQMSFEHLFSCEIEPYKQAYIERNFHPKILFRDVCELEEEYATTAYGSKVKVPGDCDLLVAGTSCVDYSNLNNHVKGLEDGGESGRTFYGMLGWVKKHRPKIVILENVCQAPWGLVIKRFTEAGYVAGHSRFDTKNFYIPHTRQRGYLVAFLDESKNASNFPERWVDIVNAKTRPASVSFEEFCLEDDHQKVVEVRVKVQNEIQRTKGTEWTACENRHENVRVSERLGRQRPFTSWQENGRSTCFDNSWRNWVDKQVDRVKDLMDINYLRSATKGIDLLFVARVHNLSQNADRNTEGKGNGITQCLTPTMIPYSTYRGGPLIGIELLSLQGLPTDQLLFTKETEANLKDLAGNAMSSTVVGTAMAAALVVGMKLLARGNATHQLASKSINPNISPIVLPRTQSVMFTDPAVCNIFELKHLKKAATKSARKCVCEAQTLTADKIQICRDCGHTSCQRCGIKPRHEYEPLQISRREPYQFEKLLKDVLPVVVRFKGVKNAVSHAILYGENLPIKDKKWDLFERHLLGALSSTFTLSSMKRKEMWVARFDSPLGRLDLLMGSQHFEWRLFVKVDNSSSDFKELRRLFTPPVAQMSVNGENGSLFEGTWNIAVPGTATVDVAIEGAGEPLDSWEKSMGLEDPAFANKMVYPYLNISLTNPVDSTLFDADINGEWKLLLNCGTACRALHSKVDENGNRIFLFIDQRRIGDGSNDGFVFARDCKRLEYGEYRPIIAKLDSVFRPTTKLKRVTTQVTANQFWTPVEGLRLKPSGGIQTEYSFSLPADITSHGTCSSPVSFLASRTRVTPALSAGFPKEWNIIDEFNAKKTFRSINWIVEGLKNTPSMGHWEAFDVMNLSLNCGICAPRKPSLSWGLFKDKVTLIEDPEEAAVWERAMKARPNPWVTALKVHHVNGQDFLLLNIGVNIVSLCHRAADLLPSGIGLGDLSVSWRLKTNYVSPPRLSFPPFTVKSNKEDQQSLQPPGFLVNLRPEQLRSLTWMVTQESSEVPFFVEQEIVEAVHPQLSWKVDVRATRPNSARGGVLADAVGYGKTAITMGLLASMKGSYSPPQDSNGRIPARGTLIIVPGHLVNQWESEITKFTGNMFEVIVIRTMGKMKALSIKDIMDADIILVPVSLVRSPIYLERLAEFTGGGDAPRKEGRKFQQWADDCAERLGPQIERLRSGNTDDVLAEINSGYERRKVAREVEQILGRKAHNAATAKKKAAAAAKKAIADAKKAVNGAKKTGNAKKKPSATKKKAPATKKKSPATKKFSAMSPQTSDTEAGSELVDAESQKKSGPSKKKATIYDDQFWKLKGLKGNWEELRTPLFELFKFNRLVLDEFTYCIGMPLHMIPGILATSRWILSGTPALGDFDDVKRIAVFLGIRLGIDDDIANSDINNRRIARDRSAVEAFHALQEARSPEWHQDRHTHAQGFLDLFMRQNVAELDEIPVEEHWINMEQPAAEKAIYIELDHHVKAMDMKVIRRGNAKSDGDRDKRLRSAIGDSQTAEEALLKSLCHFSLNIGDLGPKATARTACDHIVKQREEQLERNKKELFEVLSTALLKIHKSANSSIPWVDNPFLKFLEQKRSTNLEDAEATSAFRSILQEAKDWAIHRSGKTAKATSSLDVGDMDVDNNQSENDGPKDDGSDDNEPHDSGSDDDEYNGDESNDDEPDDNESGDGSGDEDNVARRTNVRNDNIDKDRETRLQIGRLLKELVGRFRSLRFFRVVRQVQAKDPNDRWVCACEPQRNFPLEKMNVSSICGHSACSDCMARSADRRRCPGKDSGCESLVQPGNIIPVTSLGAGHDYPTPHGAKLGKLVYIIQDVIPADERVLVFIQFPDLLRKVLSVLQGAGITVEHLSGSSKDKSDGLTLFQKNDSRRVLLLEAMAEAAAGANLTVANHVIFLSPLFAENEHQYTAAETQAIGRVRRYGQKKTVHIWRLMMKDTIDDDIYQERNNPTPRSGWDF